MEKINNNNKLQQKFSIRYKFLSVTTLLLLMCVGAYLFMATSVFKDDKINLVFDYNMTAIQKVKSEIQNLLSKTSDRIQLVASINELNFDNKKRFVNDILNNDEDIVYLGKSYKFNKIDSVSFENKTYFETYGIDSDFINNKIFKAKKIPFDQIFKSGQAVWGATIEGGPALLGFAKMVMLENSNGKPYKQFAMVALIKADRVMQALNFNSMTEAAVWSKSGQVILHPSVKKMTENAVINSELQARVQAAQVKSSVFNLEVESNKKLIAFSKLLGDEVFIISETQHSKAFEVVDKFLFRSVLFAMIILTATFMAAILFSRSLVGPLEELTKGMQVVSAGDLETQIQVNTSDEISVLANSFNHMIRDLKISRQELVDINLNLENKVKERTTQLEEQNHAVKQAQEALLRTTRLAAVGEIAGQAAHEVLNPLTSIISRLNRVQDNLKNVSDSDLNLHKDIVSAWQQDMSEGGFEKLVTDWKNPSTVVDGKSLFEEDMGNLDSIQLNLDKQVGKLSQDVEFLLRECYRINKIVQSMRGLNTIAGEKENHSLQGLVTEGVNIMADLADKIGLSLETDFSEKETYVYLDSDEFLQVLTNLIRNAIQSTQIKMQDNEQFQSASIVIKTERIENKLYTYVVDNGVGISEKNQEKLFEAQFTTKSKAEGTGLGLSISRRFVRAFGGDLYLRESIEGHGATFVIELPESELKQEVSA